MSKVSKSLSQQCEIQIFSNYSRLIPSHTLNWSSKRQSQEEVPAHSLSVKSEDFQTRDDQTSLSLVPFIVTFLPQPSEPGGSAGKTQQDGGDKRQAERHHRQKRWRGRRENEKAGRWRQFSGLFGSNQGMNSCFGSIGCFTKESHISSSKIVSSQSLWLIWKQTTCGVCLDWTTGCHFQF